MSKTFLLIIVFTIGMTGCAIYPKHNSHSFLLATEIFGEIGSDEWIVTTIWSTTTSSKKRTNHQKCYSVPTGAKTALGEYIWIKKCN